MVNGEYLRAFCHWYDFENMKERHNFYKALKYFIQERKKLNLPPAYDLEDFLCSRQSNGNGSFHSSSDH
jgi:hypothetical protein